MVRSRAAQTMAGTATTRKGNLQPYAGPRMAAMICPMAAPLPMERPRSVETWTREDEGQQSPSTEYMMGLAPPIEMPVMMRQKSSSG